MREFNEDEKLIYSILLNSDRCKRSNDECVREYILQKYNEVFPRIDECIQTIYRRIRMLKSEYPELRGSEDIQDSKLEMVSKYKEMALDRNKPIKPQETKYEEMTIGWW